MTKAPMFPIALFQDCWRLCHVFIILCFLLTGVIGPMPIYAQDYHLPAPGVMVHLSPPLVPPMLKGIKVHPENPFRFEFILDKGGSQLSNDQLKDESSNLIKYFLASLTIPEKDLWVNLSPYEKDRIIPKSFGLTEMGRDLLAEDYMLKQITASLIYPEEDIGKQFWKRIYEEASNKYGTTNIPINTFNKVWIVPQKAVVYENAKQGTAYVVESKLKVLLEQDYLSLEKHKGIQSSGKGINQLGSKIFREIVIPQLTKEVNEDKNFSHLRQVYNSLILATWYKKKIKDSILEQVYADRSKVAGVSIDDPEEKQKIYERYLRAFKKGVFNYIKEESDALTQETIPRRYFSGGEEFTDMAMKTAMEIKNAKTASPGLLSMLRRSFLNTTAFVLLSCVVAPSMTKADVENNKYVVSEQGIKKTVHQYMLDFLSTDAKKSKEAAKFLKNVSSQTMNNELRDILHPSTSGFLDVVLEGLSDQDKELIRKVWEKQSSLDSVLHFNSSTASKILTNQAIDIENLKSITITQEQYTRIRNHLKDVYSRIPKIIELLKDLNPDENYVTYLDHYFRDFQDLTKYWQNRDPEILNGEHETILTFMLIAVSLLLLYISKDFLKNQTRHFFNSYDSINSVFHPANLTEKIYIGLMVRLNHLNAIKFLANLNVKEAVQALLLSEEGQAILMEIIKSKWVRNSNYSTLDEILGHNFALDEFIALYRKEKPILTNSSLKDFLNLVSWKEDGKINDVLLYIKKSFTSENFLDVMRELQDFVIGSGGFNENHVKAVENGLSPDNYSEVFDGLLKVVSLTGSPDLKNDLEGVLFALRGSINSGNIMGYLAYMQSYYQIRPRKLRYVSLFDDAVNGNQMAIGIIATQPPELISRYTGLNIKLVRYLIAKGGWQKLKDDNFKKVINEISFQLNREKTWHPSARHLEDDEKNSLFDLLFSNGMDYQRAREIFFAYFYNDPELYAVELNKLTVLLEGFPSLDYLQKIVRLIQEDPKQSLEEIKTNLRKYLNERKKAREKIDIDFVMNNFLFITSNLFVLGDQLISVQKVAEVFKQKESSFDDQFKNARIKMDFINFLKELSKANKFVDIVALINKFSSPTNGGYFIPISSVVALKIDSIKEVSSKERFIVNVLQSLKEKVKRTEADQSDPKKVDWNDSYVDMRQQLLNVSAKSRAIIFRSFNPASLKKDPELKSEVFDGLDIPMSIDDQNDKRAIEAVVKEEQGQIPHIFLEPLLRINVSNETLDQFLVIIRAIGTQNESALLKNRLYEAVARFSINLDANRAEVFLGILKAALRYNGGVVNEANIQAVHSILMRLLSVTSRVMGDKLNNVESVEVDMNFFRQQAREAVLELASEGVQAVSMGKKFEITDLGSLEYKLAKVQISTLLATFENKAVKVSKSQEEILLNYFRSVAGDWRDHEERSLADVLNYFLDRSWVTSEVARVMFDSLLSEASGTFKEYKFSSPDYIAFIDGVVEYIAGEEKLGILQEAQGKTLYEKLQNIKEDGFDSIRQRVEEIKNGVESIITMELPNDINGMKVQLSHDYNLMVNIGNYPRSTACQNVMYPSAINLTLAGYVADGTVLAVTYVDSQGRVVAPRRMIKLLLAEVNGRKRPVIFVEENTQFGGGEKIKNLYKLVDELGRKTGFAVVTSSQRASLEIQGTRGDETEMTLYGWGKDNFRYPPYSDARVGIDDVNEAYPLLDPSKAKSTNDEAMLTASDEGRFKWNSEKRGGIDFTSSKFLKIQNAGQAIKFHIDAARLAQLQNAPGFVPVIISIKPMVNIKAFLGLDSADGITGL